MVECEEAALELLVAHKQFAESVEPAVAHLNHPAPGLVLRVAALGLGLRATADHMRDVAMAFYRAKMLRASVARIGAQMFVSSVGRVLALDNNCTEHRIKPLAVMYVGPAHDERQRDATTVHQQMAFASLFSPGPSG